MKQPGKHLAIIWKAVILFTLMEGKSFGYTANKVAFEFLDNGQYRVIINYTVPELKEFREAQVDFKLKKEAEDFYWSLVRGADFFPSSPRNIRFVAPPTAPDPW
jgi:hypothetical protein